MPGKTGKKGPALAFLAIAPAIFAADRALKVLVASRFSEGEGVPVITGVFHVTLVNNTGAALGLFRGAVFFLIGVSVAFAAFLVWTMRDALFSAEHPARVRTLWAASLVLGGALGNLYDRVRFGHVIDYLDFRVWPVFNLADVSICAGVFLFAIGLFDRARTR